MAIVLIIRLNLYQQFLLIEITGNRWRTKKKKLIYLRKWIHTFPRRRLLELVTALQEKTLGSLEVIVGPPRVHTGKIGLAWVRSRSSAARPLRRTSTWRSDLNNTNGPTQSPVPKNKHPKLLFTCFSNYSALRDGVWSRIRIFEEFIM
jgi:hypothetical protein